ncbi:MAG: hypothetical protein HC912_07645 [Saprospiraceae bacterium]|nr:hypothetical protein [Saprospiraceae bacterium]
MPSLSGSSGKKAYIKWGLSVGLKANAGDNPTCFIIGNGYSPTEDYYFLLYDHQQEEPYELRGSCTVLWEGEGVFALPDPISSNSNRQSSFLNITLKQD